MSNLTFKTREQYLAWRAEWRAEYKTLSETIRNFKNKRSQKFKDGEDASAIQMLLVRQAIKANEMMEVRTESKNMAREQYQATYGRLGRSIMSAHGMKPLFSDIEGYRRWRAQWRSLYKRLSADIHHAKIKVKTTQKEFGGAAKLQKNLHFQRVMAYKTMSLLQEGKDRWKRILDMNQAIVDQMATFPLTLENCRTIDFHYNRASNEFPELPMWVLKCKGRTYYVHHVNAECAWSTHERPDSSTRGMMRFSLRFPHFVSVRWDFANYGITWLTTEYELIRNNDFVVLRLKAETKFHFARKDHAMMFKLWVPDSWLVG